MAIADGRLGAGFEVCATILLVARLARTTIRVGHRLISAGDENALLPQEAPYFRNAALKVRRQSGAARMVARALLDRADAAILKTPSGAPKWPLGVVGSLAHDQTIAVAAIAKSIDNLSIGIDIEPTEPLPEDIVDMISTDSERTRYNKCLLQSRQLFVAKEAAYKAVFPLDGVFLDFQDIEVDLTHGVAFTKYGRRVAINVVTSSHLIALAHVQSQEASSLGT